MDKNIGAMLDGRYEVKKRIGVGGMADVYKAYDVEEGMDVAVKVLRNEFINNDEFLQRFKNESKAVSMLSHPNIVKVLDVGFNEDVRYIVMEYIDGITLKDYIDQQGCVDWKETVHLLIQILRGLQHAHDRGIIHRDIKPQNIMMFEDGTIKVMDFGIAKFTYELGITATAQTIGSVHYISPEQASGKITDCKSDIYSVGILMYEMVTGKKPFDTDNPVTVAIMQMNDTAEKPRSINPDIPEGIEEIILKAIEKQPADRYQSAKEMIRDLEMFKNSPDMVFGYYKKEEDQEKFDEYGDDEQISGEKYKSIYDIPQQQIRIDDEGEQNYYIGNKKESTVPDNSSDEENEPEARSPMVRVMTGFTVVALIALIFGGLMIFNRFKNREVAEEYFEMPLLLQYNYNDMVKKYGDEIDIRIDGDPIYSQYVADAIVSQSIDAGKEVAKGTAVYVKISNGKNKFIVPDVVNKTEEEAIKLINDMGVSVKISPEFDDVVEYNRVIKTDPVAGTELEITKSVTVYISKGAENDAKPVPLVEGMLREEAEKLLKDFGFTVVVEEKDDKAPKDTVLSQSLPADTLVNPNEKIVIYVSSGKAPESMVPITIVFPERVFGEYTFKVYINDEFSFAKTNVNAEVAKNMKFEVRGSEKKTVKIEAQNLASQETEVIGIYEFNFEDGKIEKKSENIKEAFEKLGGIKPEETTPAVTTTVTVPTHPATDPVTEPPATEPPVTEPPATEPTVTEPPVTDPPVTDPPVTEPSDTDPPPADTEPSADPVEEPAE